MSGGHPSSSHETLTNAQAATLTGANRSTLKAEVCGAYCRWNGENKRHGTRSVFYKEILTTMLNDQPSKNDPLGRLPFAKAIARIIATQTDPAPQVIAIDGAWGEGKTTVFGFLSDALKSKDFKVIDFNPWRHGDDETMIRAFALELGKTLKVKLLNKREQIVESAQDRADWFQQAANAIGADKVGGFLNFGARKLRVTVQQLMERAKGELNCHNRRVTILIDDSDRLETDQLMGLFRLIKLSADFEWLTFVLAMDCAAVGRTIGRRFGGDDEGQRFLEKIIQVPVRLPTIPHGKLREFTLDLIQNVINDLGLDLNQSDVSRFRESFDPTIMPLIRTPRSAKQYANVIRFSLGLLPHEVNTADVMLLEGMRLFARPIFERVKDHIIPVVDPHWVEDIMDQQHDKSAKTMKRLLDGFSDDESNYWRNTLIALFPSRLSSASHDEHEFLNWTHGKRVACDEYFIRYLAAVVPDDDVPDAIVTQWMERAEQGDLQALVENLKSALNAKTETTFVQKLRRIEHRLSAAQREAFAVATAMISSSLTLRDIAWQHEVAFGQSAIFAALCVRNLGELARMERLAQEVIRDASLGMWAVEFYWNLPHEHNQQSNDESEKKYQVFSNEISNRLGRALADRLMDELESASERPQPHVLRRVFLISSRYGDIERIRSWTKSELSKDPSFIDHFGSLIMKWTYGGEERHQEWPGDPKALELAGNYVDAEWLAQTFELGPTPAGDRSSPYISDEEAACRLLRTLKSHFHRDSRPDKT